MLAAASVAGRPSCQGVGHELLLAPSGNRSEVFGVSRGGADTRPKGKNLTCQGRSVQHTEEATRNDD
eukprot:2358341-Pyramimonas_sp.AAC.1